MKTLRAFILNPKTFWAVWGATGIAWQANALRTSNGGTGSETTRAIWRTHTPLGKWAFLSAFYAGSTAFLMWFPGHIVNKALEGSISFKDQISGNQ